MKTAVQLRRSAGADPTKTELLCGNPCSVVAGTLGPIAVFGSGEVVGYRILHRRRSRTFVFRTLDVDDRFAATVPGVKPHVELLLEVGSAGRARLVRGLFRYLARRGHAPSELADAFYLRVAATLGGRLPAHKVLVSLLAAAQE